MLVGSCTTWKKRMINISRCITKLHPFSKKDRYDQESRIFFIQIYWLLQVLDHPVDASYLPPLLG
ncbi:MAG: hypothetical protein ACTSXP_14020 [Promethearchaeota archaeon]